MVVVAAIVLRTTSWLVSGRPRQFMVMWENSRCSIWVKYGWVVGRRQLARSGHWPMALRPVGLGGGGELDGVAEFLQLADQAAGLVLGVRRELK